MTDERSNPDTGEATPATSYTGVATGSVGTGTALDDTQVYRTEDLAGRPDDEPEGEDDPEGEDGLPLAAAAAPASVVSPPGPLETRGLAPEPRPRPSRGNPLVGVAAVVGAAALVVLAATALVGNRGTGSAVQSLPTFDLGAGPSASSAPSPTDSAGGSGRGHGNDNGNKTHKP